MLMKGRPSEEVYQQSTITDDQYRIAGWDDRAIADLRLKEAGEILEEAREIAKKGSESQNQISQNLLQQETVHSDERFFGMITPVSSIEISIILLILGLVSWIISGWLLSNLELSLANALSGLSWMFFFAAIVNGVHSVERTIRKSLV